jgi:hypothetical protein
LPLPTTLIANWAPASDFHFTLFYTFKGFEAV